MIQHHVERDTPPPRIPPRPRTQQRVHLVTRSLTQIPPRTRRHRIVQGGKPTARIHQVRPRALAGSRVTHKPRHELTRIIPTPAQQNVCPLHERQATQVSHPGSGGAHTIRATPPILLHVLKNKRRTHHRPQRLLTTLTNRIIGEPMLHRIRKPARPIHSRPRPHHVQRERRRIPHINHIHHARHAHLAPQRVTPIPVRSHPITLRLEHDDRMMHPRKMPPHTHATTPRFLTRQLVQHGERKLREQSERLTRTSLTNSEKTLPEALRVHMRTLTTRPHANERANGCILARGRNRPGPGA